MLIYLPKPGPRSRYVMELVFAETWGLPLEWTGDPARYLAHTGPKLAYASSPPPGPLGLVACGFLEEEGVRPVHPACIRVGGIPALFPVTGSPLPFDVFAAIFFMVSRYEEYLVFSPDAHGRFPAVQSLAWKQGFLTIPVVNRWIELLRGVISQNFPDLEFRESVFRPVLTYDIDSAYAFLGRSAARTVGAGLSDLVHGRVRRVIERVRVLRGLQDDPSDTYGMIVGSRGAVRGEKIFFFPAADRGPQDRNLSINHPLVAGLARRLSQWGRTGLHPSYRSNSDPEKIRIEKNRLEKVLGQPVTISRQHFLRFRLPDTFRALLSCGIREEYSMGFADQPGFRAGTCQPFYFYDLGREQKTALRIFPITFMDGTFRDYLHRDPAASWETIKALILETQKSNGIFMSIWHNSSLSDRGDWNGWKELHDRIVREFQTS